MASIFLHHLAIFTIAAAAAARPVLATRVPPGTQQGTYIVTLSPEGQEIHARLPDINHDNAHVLPLPPPPPPPPPQSPRGATAWPSHTAPLCSDSPWIGTYDLYHDNGARNAFSSQCAALAGARLGNGDKIYSHWGDAVAYMCSYAGSGGGGGGGGGNPCVVQEWVDAVDWAAASCAGRNGGYMECAYLSIPGWKKAYGYTHINTSFC
ncbi:hypothetical protein CORC01_02084 [Colletotrichum orchidophilum]|uniref:Uncharacterized protein n=1 Tax=Colletotrichum orchidophilum TaxID=1209926 RepID=A0A1G4BN03_9PEZI|nr:uncharacterized protein CORC01_02084 [Colletotrichum orchidophilum]OHF02688.1 hypothetical protein CORC01_02084 [Colletotrichum orchidophilum]